MRFALPTLSAAQILIAQNPEIGLESNVFVSAVEVTKLGTIKTDAAGAITWTPRPGASYNGATGVDIHVALEKPIVGTLAPVVTLDCTIVTAGAGTAAATLAVPSYVGNQNQVYPSGVGFDMIPQGVGNSARLITAITGVTSLTNVPANSELTVWGSQASSNFVELGWKKSVDGAYSTNSVVSLPNKYNATAATKKGRGEVNELKMDFSHLNSMDGISRYDGSRVSVLIKIIKDDTVTTEHILYCGHRLNVVPKRGEGNEEVIESSSGPVESCIRFLAP